MVVIAKENVCKVFAYYHLGKLIIYKRLHFSLVLFYLYMFYFTLSTTPLFLAYATHVPACMHSPVLSLPYNHMLCISILIFVRMTECKFFIVLLVLFQRLRSGVFSTREEFVFWKVTKIPSIGLHLYQLPKHLIRPLLSSCT